MKKKEILLLQEAERKRIAEELHDTTVQDMICLSQQLELIFIYMDRDVIQAKLETAVARKRIKRVISEMRETIYDLRPMMIDDIGWQASFERLKDKLLMRWISPTGSRQSRYTALFVKGAAISSSIPMRITSRLLSRMMDLLFGSVSGTTGLELEIGWCAAITILGCSI